MRLLLAVAVASILLAGCGSIQQDTHFTVAEDAPSHADAHTGDGYQLNVRVVDQNGTPVQGAAVVFFTMSDAFGSSAEASASASSGEGGARAESVVFYSFSFSSYEMIAGARTNAEGLASADLPPNEPIHVAAGDADGMTTEVRMNVAVASGGQSGTITITLYPQFISNSFDVSMGNQVGRAGVMGSPYEAFPMAFDDVEELSEAYASRILSMGVDASWTNNVEQGADLFVGIGGDDARWIGDDTQQIVLDGDHTESVTVTSGDLDGHRATMTAQGYQAYLFTDWASLSFDGLPVRIDVEAELKGSNIVIQ